MADNMPSKKFKTSDYIPPINSELAWVFIDAPGKPAMDPTKPNRKTATLIADAEEAQPLIDAIEEFWKENKGKGWKKKSLGFKPEMTLKEGGDRDNEDDWEETGRICFNFWTGATWPDGKDREIAIYNAKGNKVSLAGKKIGNGSRGAISGTMMLYDAGAASRGVTLFLNAIQLLKFVEYTDDAGFDSYDDEEGAFEGVDTEFDEVSSDEPRPEL